MVQNNESAFSILQLTVVRVPTTINQIWAAIPEGIGTSAAWVTERRATGGRRIGEGLRAAPRARS